MFPQFLQQRQVLHITKTLFSADPSKIPLLGDALVIAGTVCYAFSNTGEVGDLLYLSCYYQRYFHKNTNNHIIFLDYVGILCQEERSSRTCGNAWTIWGACQWNSDVSSPQFIINYKQAHKTNMICWYCRLSIYSCFRIIKISLQFVWNKNILHALFCSKYSCYL